MNQNSNNFTLKHLSNGFKKRPGPLLLVILDGVAIGKPDAFNAVHVANTPCLDKLIKSPLYTQLKAHGPAVGMPSEDDMGNSEVGHNTLGAGRAIAQGASLVKQAIESREIFNADSWKSSIEQVNKQQTTLHFLGLLSDGNVHAHIDHLIALVQQAASEGVKTVRCHCLLDGRDVDEKSALTYIDKLEQTLSAINEAENMDYKIASGGGRMLITMDRYNADWNMVKRGWETHVLGQGKGFSSSKQAIQTFYDSDSSINDQYLPPFVIEDSNGNPIGKINDGDAVILTNFRGDRAIEISMAFEQDNFDKFDRKFKPNIHYAGMLCYDGDLGIPNHYLVDPPFIADPISTYLCNHGVRSFAISETQKYGHVTYFWNGNKSGYIEKELETYIEIPSYTVPFDERPEMRAPEITEKSLELLYSGNFDFGRINFPNGDMVGHTGNFEATVKSVEEGDKQLQRLLDAIEELNGVAIVLADHGNADEMVTEKNNVLQPKTCHTLNPVPCGIIDPCFDGSYSIKKGPHLGLSNVAATICNFLGFEAPEHYDESLLNFSPTQTVNNMKANL